MGGARQLPPAEAVTRYGAEPLACYRRSSGVYLQGRRYCGTDCLRQALLDLIGQTRPALRPRRSAPIGCHSACFFSPSSFPPNNCAAHWNAGTMPCSKIECLATRRTPELDHCGSGGNVHVVVLTLNPAGDIADCRYRRRGPLMYCESMKCLGLAAFSGQDHYCQWMPSSEGPHIHTGASPVNLLMAF